MPHLLIYTSYLVFLKTVSLSFKTFIKRFSKRYVALRFKGDGTKMKPISKSFAAIYFFPCIFWPFFFWFLLTNFKMNASENEIKIYWLQKADRKWLFLGITEIKLLTITNFLLSSFLNCFPSLHGLCLQFYSSTTNYYSVKPKKKLLTISSNLFNKKTMILVHFRLRKGRIWRWWAPQDPQCTPRGTPKGGTTREPQRWECSLHCTSLGTLWNQ